MRGRAMRSDRQGDFGKQLAAQRRAVVYWHYYFGPKPLPLPNRYLLSSRLPSTYRQLPGHDGGGAGGGGVAGDPRVGGARGPWGRGSSGGAAGRPPRNAAGRGGRAGRRGRRRGGWAGARPRRARAAGRRPGAGRQVGYRGEGEEGSLAGRRRTVAGL